MQSYKMTKLAVLIAIMSAGNVAYAEEDATASRGDSVINDEFLGEEAERHTRSGLTGEESRSAENPNQEQSGESDQNMDGRDSDSYTTSASDVKADGMDEPYIVHFEFDSAELTSEAKENLEPVIERLSNEQQPAVVGIAGYTDTTGPAEYNKDLAERRAEAVQEYVAQQDVEVESWDLRAQGEEQPIAPNDNPQGRQENRRVEIRLSDDSGLSSI